MASTSGLCKNAGTSWSLIISRSIGRKAPKQGKPPILPPSKTVRYHVVHVPWQEPQYVEELLWRRHVYNNAMISIKKLFKDEIKSKEEQGMGIEALREQELVELDELIAQNDERNRKSAEQRKVRDAERQEEIRKMVLKEMEETLNKEYEEAEERTKEVVAIIERSANFVNKDNLDQKILEALEKPKVFDFCINLRGDKYYDPEPVKYQTGTPTRQKGRVYDRTLFWEHRSRAADVKKEEKAEKTDLDQSS